MILALYLLLVAGLLLFLNIRTRQSQVAKFVSYVGMWAAIGGSVVAALLR